MCSSAGIATMSLLVLAALSTVPAQAAEPTLVGDPTKANPDSTAYAAVTASDPGSTTNAGPPSPPSDNSQSGISSQPNNNTTLPPLGGGLPLAPSGPPRVGLFPQFGQTLLDQGIDIHGVAFDHFLGNPSAGTITGQTYNLAGIAPAIDLDLQKLAGIPGGNLHIRVTFFGLRSNIPTIITDAGGYLTGNQTTPAPSTTQAVISVLTYEQKLLNDRLSIEVGRTNVFRSFLIPNSLDPFTYFSSVVQTVGDVPSSVYPVWGGVASYHLTPKWYVQGGAFEDDFIRAVNNPDIFGVEHAPGAELLGEIAQRSEFNNARYPSNAELGFEWNTRTDDYSPYDNIKGSPNVATTRNQAYSYPGGGVLFFQGEKVLWRGAGRRDGPPANIAVYGAADVSVDKPQPVDFDCLAGFNFTGLIPGRPSDALGLQVHYQRLSAIEANYETRIQDIFAGPGPRQSRDGYAFEAVINLQVTPWLQVRPIGEYVLDPDNLVDPAQRRRPSSGFIAGIFTSIALGRLLGTSNKSF